MDSKKVKNLGYRMGQVFAVVVGLCVLSLIVCITIALITKIFTLI